MEMMKYGPGDYHNDQDMERKNGICLVCGQEDIAGVGTLLLAVEMGKYCMGRVYLTIPGIKLW